VKASLHRILQRCGEEIARLWLVLAALSVHLAFPLSGIVASLLVGYAASSLTGGGTYGAISFCVTAFLFGLFLSVYVWQPYVKRAVHSASHLMGKAADRRRA
jgi:membrane protein implicated in regulation of membrane protease activity